MALSRKFLKAMGLTEEQIDSVVEAHRETVDGLQKSLTSAEEKAKKFDEVEKELNEIKKANSGKEDFKTKYENEHTAFEKYKSEITAKETRTAKETAVKAYFEEKNIVGKNQAIAMRGVKSDIDKLILDDQGKIKDTTSLDELIKGDYAGLISTTKIKGANTPNPPANTGSGKMTKEQIFAIADDVERQKAIAENHELFNF